MIKNFCYGLVVLLLLPVLTSCSFKTFYNHLDYLIPEYVDGMVSLDGMLEDKVEHGSGLLINWHRNTQLRQYAEWLRDMQRDVGNGLSEQQAMQRIDQVAGFWQALTRQINNQLAQLLPLLDEQQRHELFASLAENNEEYRQDYLLVDDEQRLEHYSDRLLDNYENWLGDISETQRDAIRQAAQQLQSSAELRLQRRLRWQQGIHRILNEAITDQQKTEQLRVFLAGFEQPDNTAMRDISEHNRRLIARLTVQLAQTMNDAQKNHFISETDDYIRMFTELAEER